MARRPSRSAVIIGSRRSPSGGILSGLSRRRYPDDGDLNHPTSGGVGAFPLNNPDGIRMSTALTYLQGCRHRQNLSVKANALVRRILFTGQRAAGVELDSGGETFVVEAEDIILSAGAIQSPQILMLSGVGPADHLRHMGLPVVHDLPGLGNMKKITQGSRCVTSRKHDLLDPNAPEIRWRCV